MSMSPGDFASENQSDAASYHKMDEPAVPPDTAEAQAANTTPSAAETQAANTTPSAEEALPPEAQGEANGGPLGCCLGVIFGLLFGAGLVLALSYFYSPLLRQTLASGMSLTVRIIMVLAAIIGMLIFGQLGWKLGKKAYREYEPPVIKVQARQRQPGLNVQARTTTRHRSGAKRKSHTSSKSAE